jgi:molybdenum cofactor cytidylyltransferase
MISAIILAAGLSKRMKLGNKLLLEKNNVPIIKTTLERVAASKVNEVIVVLGKDPSLIKNKVNDKRVKCVTNIDYRNGISSSIKKGLKKVNKNNIGAMICLADMPLIKTGTYNQIINSYYQNNRKNIIPYFEHIRGNPVLFDKLYFKDLMEIEGDEGARVLIKKHPEIFFNLTVLDQGIIKDIDDANQYYEFLKNE